MNCSGALRSVNILLRILNAIFPELVLASTSLGFLLPVILADDPISKPLRTFLSVILGTSTLASFFKLFSYLYTRKVNTTKQTRTSNASIVNGNESQTKQKQHEHQPQEQARPEKKKDPESLVNSSTIFDYSASVIWPDTVSSILRPDTPCIWILYPFVTVLCIHYTVRLFQSDTKYNGGRAVDFNFGYKQNTNEFNRSFEPGFDSWGHFTQGFFNAFLSLPAVVGILSRGFSFFRKPSLIVLYLLELACVGCVFYPVYNLVKRASRKDDDFATSSYMNNGAEWAIGHLVGISSGLFISNLIQYILIRYHANNNSKFLLKEHYPNSPVGFGWVFGKSSDYKSVVHCTIYYFCLLLRYVLFGAMAVSVIMGIVYNVQRNEYMIS